MVTKNGLSRKIFNVCNITFLNIVTVVCILPFVHLLALSLSGSTAAAAGKVTFWPVDFTLKSYSFLLEKSDFIVSLGVTLKRVVLGTTLNMLLIVLTAYPLSKSPDRFCMVFCADQLLQRRNDPSLYADPRFEPVRFYLGVGTAGSSGGR